MNRRVVIGIALAVLGLIAVTGLGLLVAGDDRRLGAADNRSYVANNFYLELDGVSSGAVASVEGCEIGADVVSERLGADQVARKHLGPLQYDPCVIKFGPGMAVGVYQWIAAMLNGNAGTKNLTIVVTDYSRKVKQQVALSQALLTKVKFPALDGAAKDSGFIELTVQPETIQKTVGSGSTYSSLGGKELQKKWIPSNFRLTLNGVNDTTKVSTISAFVAEQEVVEDGVGEFRDYEKVPGKLELGNLVVSISPAHSAGFDSWFNDFVIKGNSQQDAEKSGTIEFLDTKQSLLFRLSLSGVGIFRAGESSSVASKEAIARKTFSLYVEEASFDYLVSSSAASTAGGTGTGTTTTLQTTPPPIQQPAAPIEAFITAVSANVLVDGETFMISDGVNEPTTFEFDLDGEAAGGIAVKIEKDAPPEVVADAIINAINGVSDELQIVAKPAGPELKIQLQSERGAEAGEEKILEFVENESFTVRDAVPAKEGEGLAAPAELKATTGAAEGEIDLAWAASEGALGYIVAFRTEPEGEYIDLEKTDGTELTLAGLESGATHYFVVRATDGTNESKNSNEASALAG